MDKTRYEFGNMSALNIIKTEKFKTNAVIINYICPLDEIESGNNALLSAVLTRSSKEYPKMNILNRRLESLYGATLSAVPMKLGDNQVISFVISFLDDAYAINNQEITKECIKMIFEIIYNPLIVNGGFVPEYIESEKKNLIDKIKSEINEKRTYALNECIKLMCKDEKFSINKLGSIEQIEKINEKSLYEAYKNLIEKSVIESYYIGNIHDEQSIKNEFEKQFLSVKRNACEIAKTEIKTGCIKPKFFEKVMDVVQGKLVFGFRTDKITKENKAAYLMMNEIYGGGVTSKLFLNVREKMSLCYYCSSMINNIKSIMLVSAGIEFDKKETAEKEILNQLENVKKGDFSDDDINHALKSLVNDYKNISDSLSSIASYDLSNIMSKIEFTPEEMIEQLKKVTKEDIIGAAEKVTLDTVFFLKGNK